MDKRLIRKVMKEKRLLIDKKIYAIHNQEIMNKVLSHNHYQSSSLIGIYVSLPNEVSTHQLIKQTLKNKRVCVPKIENNVMNFYEIHSFDELSLGYFNVLEPTTDKPVLVQDIELMITPLLAYDHTLYRVGYGKGYYDKYFSSGFNGYKLGLAFSFQQIDQIHVDQFDYRLDEIITEIN